MAELVSKEQTQHQIHFGTDGWRAIIAREFNQDNLTLFNLGLAAYLLRKYPPGTPLVIGYDARFMADRFADYTSKLLNTLGIPTLICPGHHPTPVVAHAALVGREGGTAGALMFTASHNPPEYMGIKYIPEYAGPATLEITNAILSEINTLASRTEIYGLGLKASTALKELVSGLGIKLGAEATSSNIDPYPQYLARLKQIIDFDLLRRINASKAQTVIYDPIYGAGRGFGDRILREAGFNVITLHDIQDYGFGGGQPEPQEQYLTELKARVISEHALFGGASDGDADRFAIISDDGGFFPANKAMSIILKYLLEHPRNKETGTKGVVARTVVTTHLLDEIAAKFGVKTIETAVGFKWLGEIMRREPTIIAAEESGGMSVLGHIPEKDGLLAILLMAEVIAATSKSPTQLWEEVQNFVGKHYYYHRLDLHMEGAAKSKFIATFADPNLRQIAGYSVLRTDSKEGTKVYLDNGAWFVARPSGTEAMCRVYIEANDEASLKKIATELEAIVAKI